MDDTFDEFGDELDQEIAKATKKTEVKPTTSAASIHSLLVNPRQKGNPLLKHISNITWEFSDIIPDYQMGTTVCALFLSLQYHNLNPDYIHERLKALVNKYELRVLLVQVDVREPHHALKNLTRVCLLADLTLILAWSPEEAGKILETYRIYEKKPADRIRERSETSPYLQLVQALTAIRSINKTDAQMLLDKYKTIENILKVKEDRLAELPGIGPKKAQRLYKTLHEEFLKAK